jgi:hypothetical protein
VTSSPARAAGRCAAGSLRAVLVRFLVVSLPINIGCTLLLLRLT